MHVTIISNFIKVWMKYNKCCDDIIFTEDSTNYTVFQWMVNNKNTFRWLKYIYMQK